MKLKKAPPGARHLKTYSEFENYLRDFATGAYPFLYITGRPGICKSESIEIARRGQLCYYRKGGQLTPLQLYIDLYHHRGQPVILDDAEHILESRLGEKLISALGDTTRVRPLSYASTARQLGNVPQSFETTSPLCIIANKPTNHAALCSRAVALYFDPTQQEVHSAVARWFWCQEIHDWVGQHLTRLPPLDARWYVHAYNDRETRRDWRQILLDTHAPDRFIQIVQDLESDPSFPTREDKARRFMEMTGKSRSPYFNIRRRLEAEGRMTLEPVEPIRLGRTRPPVTLTPDELEAASVQPVPDQEPSSPPLNLPLRDAFSQSITGRLHPQQQQGNSDDTLAWEKTTMESEDDGEP